MASVQKIIQSAEAKCKSNDTRFTSKRKQVLTGILNSEKAISAYELAEYCNQHFDEQFPIMTIYRILDFLQKESFVHKLQTSKKYVACSHITCQHEHLEPLFLICSECQKVKETHISKSVFSELNSSAQQAGFGLANSQLEVSGLCDECSRVSH